MKPTENAITFSLLCDVLRVQLWTYLHVSTLRSGLNFETRKVEKTTPSRVKALSVFNTNILFNSRKLNGTSFSSSVLLLSLSGREIDNYRRRTQQVIIIFCSIFCIYKIYGHRDIILFTELISRNNDILVDDKVDIYIPFFYSELWSQKYVYDNIVIYWGITLFLYRPRPLKMYQFLSKWGRKVFQSAVQLSW